MNPNEAGQNIAVQDILICLLSTGETVPLNKNIGGMTSYVFTSLVAELTDIPCKTSDILQKTKISTSIIIESP